MRKEKQGELIRIISKVILFKPGGKRCAAISTNESKVWVLIKLAVFPGVHAPGETLGLSQDFLAMETEAPMAQS